MTPNTDNPDKPEPVDSDTLGMTSTKKMLMVPLPPANQGDDELADMLQHIYMNDSIYFSFTEDGVHPNKTAIALVQAQFNRQLAERLQQILDSPLLQNEPNHYGGIDYTTKKEHRNELRHYIRESIRELMP